MLFISCLRSCGLLTTKGENGQTRFIEELPAKKKKFKIAVLSYRGKRKIMLFYQCKKITILISRFVPSWIRKQSSFCIPR